jgi:hypothetical protein
MIAIGHYRFVWAGGPEILTATKPFYGKRTIWLSSIRATVLQVLVPFLGQMIWINVRESDIVMGDQA